MTKKKRTQSQIGKMSRRKGKAFECQMARYFTKWTGVKWETTRNSGRTDLKGDIYCVSEPDMDIVIECKHRVSYSVHAMLKPTKAFTDMIEETREKLSDNHYVIFIVKNETGIWMSNTQVDKEGFWGELYEEPCHVNNLQSCGISWSKIQDYDLDEDKLDKGVYFGCNPKTA